MLARAGLLTRLLVLVAVATLPAVFVLVYIQLDLRADRRTRLAEDATRQVELLNADLGSIIEGARQLALALGHSSRIAQSDPACAAELRDVLADAPVYERLVLLDAHDSIVCASDDQRGHPPAALAALAATARQSGRFETGEYVAPSEHLGAQLPFAIAFTAPDGDRPVIIAALSLHWLALHLADFRRAPGSAIVVADRNGTILARVPQDHDYVGAVVPPTLRGLIDAPHRGIADITGLDGKPRLAGFIPTGETPVGLYLGVGLSLTDLTQDIDRVAQRGYVLIAIGAALAFALTLVGGERFIRRPTRHLVAVARRWSAGDTDARARLPRHTASEFAGLADALNAMADASHRQRAELENLNATLEQRVDARTTDLVESRNRLQIEVAEREKTEASLQQAQKLQAIGQLAGGIAHDFNNILTAVTGALELLRRRLTGTSENLVRLTDDALQATERGGRLTAQLLAFARRQRLLPAPTDLNATIVGLTHLLGSTLDRRVRIETRLAPDLWPAMVDAAQVESAVLNLALNARDAMEDGGVLTIVTANVTERESDFVMVRVADTGTGMSPEVLERVFEPFFTTKEPGRGSGLGLSQVHGLAVQSGGDVRITSWEGEGTSVTLLLPRAPAQPERPIRPDRAGRRAARAGVRILVVDDDQDVREMICEMLREAGFAVAIAAGGAEALARIDAEPDFTLLLADYAMPGMNGIELIAAVRCRAPAIRTLLVTGYAEFRSAEVVGVEQIVRKPFTIRTLVARIEDALRAPHPLPADG